jgi:hypothetical protein
MLPAPFLAAQRVRTCLLYNVRDKARLSPSGRLQDDPFVPTQKKYAMHHLARSIEVCRQYYLLRAGDLAEINLHMGRKSTIMQLRESPRCQRGRAHEKAVDTEHTQEGVEPFEDAPPPLP